MTDEKRRILVVDDSPDDIQILMENLKPYYAMLAATNGEKALTLARKSPQPDVILLDVSMPGMNGYEVCRALQQDADTAHISVIFVSAHDTTEEKLAGYEAGGTDYLIKPVHPEELLQKVRVAIRNKDAALDAEKGRKHAFSAAMTALTSAGEQGVVLEFMRKSFAANTSLELGRLIVDACDNLGISVSIQLRTHHSCTNVGSVEPVPPLEQELLERLKDSGRLLESGRRLFANFGAISCLIRLMPADEEKAGRIRDHICMLLEGAEARIHAIEANEELSRLIADCQNALKEIQSLNAEQKEKGLHIMDEVRKALEASFETHTFTDYQESLILDVVYEGASKTVENLEYGLRIDEQMQVIVDRLAFFTKHMDGSP